MAPPVFKTGLAANIVAGGFDSLPPPPTLGGGQNFLIAWGHDVFWPSFRCSERHRDSMRFSAERIVHSRSDIGMRCAAAIVAIASADAAASAASTAIANVHRT